MSPGSPATTNAPDRTGGALVLDDVSVRYGEVVAVDGAR